MCVCVYVCTQWNTTQLWKEWNNVFCSNIPATRGFPSGAMQEMPESGVRSPDQEDHVGEGMATHSSVLQLEIVIVTEGSQTEKDKYMTSIICEISLSLSLSLYIYIYIYALTHTHTRELIYKTEIDLQT